MLLGATALVVGLGASIALAKKPPLGSAPFDMQSSVSQATEYMQAIAKAVEEANQLTAQLSAEGQLAKSAQTQETLRMMERLVTMSQRAYDALQKAAAQNDPRRAEREFVKVTVAYQRVLDLMARLRADAGSTTTGSADGDPEVQLTKDSDLPVTNPQAAPSAIDTLTVDTGRPPATSPFN